MKTRWYIKDQGNVRVGTERRREWISRGKLVISTRHGTWSTDRVRPSLARREQLRRSLKKCLPLIRS